MTPRSRSWDWSAAGIRHAAASLADGLLEAASAFGWRLPELFSGHARAEVPWPSPYPPSCRPQAWAAAAAGALVQGRARARRRRARRLGARLARAPAGRPSPAPLRVDGLVAGAETFSAGIDADGSGYVDGLSLALVPG